MRMNHCVVGVILFGTLVTCGREKVSSRTPKPSQEEAKVADLPEIVKGRWEFRLGEREGFGLIDTASSTQTITGTVQAAVNFTMSNVNFVDPEARGIASYGTLDVTELRDNSLRVCGANGRSKCTTAEIRIYTKDTPRPGLWNDVEAIGLPISTNALPIGLDQVGAVSVKAVVIGNKTVIRLTDFISNGALLIPISVDFSDAGAGSYRSTLVVEYLTR